MATGISPPVPRILLVEDDRAAAALVSVYLQQEGFLVDVCSDGVSGLARLLEDPPDVAVLDWMLPGLDGIGLCRAARARWSGPILMLTARTDEVDEIVALEVGVDDFVAKPVRPRVLLARIRALLRRAAPADPAERLTLGALVIDRSRREVVVHARPVSLTTAEFDLLWALAARAGQPVTREELYRDLRGIGYDGIDRSIDMRVSQLRRRLRLAWPGWDDPIRTVRGTGYQLVRP